MKTKRTKRLSLLLAALLLFTLAPYVGATPLPEQDTPPQYENGYQFQILQTEDGPVLTEIYYVGREEERSDVVFLPQTLGGLPVTPDVVDGMTFWYGDNWGAVKVSADNPYFKSVGGALYTKDGKTLVYMPNPYNDPILTVPDGVEAIGEAALWNASCAILPDSVREIEDAYGRISYLVIAANSGTAAEAIAQEHGCKFVPLDAEHSHIYFRGSVLKEATCSEGGVTELVCPCSAAIQAETSVRWHRFRESYNEETDEWEYRCAYCGRTFGEIFGEYIGPDPEAPSPDECTCVCHKFDDTMPSDLSASGVIRIVRDFFYRLQLVLWRIAGTHKYCECGERHY